MMNSNQMKPGPNVFTYETGQQNIDRNSYNPDNLPMQQNQNHQNYPHPNNILFGPGAVSDRDTMYYNRQFINAQGYHSQIMPNYTNNQFFGMQPNSSFGSSNIEKIPKLNAHFNNSREEQDESSGHTIVSSSKCDKDTGYETQNLKRPAISTDAKTETKNIKVQNTPQSKKQSGRPRKLVQPNKVAETAKSSNVPKTREPLTEGEKKANHVFSEQRRRELIRKGFNLLCEINPGLSSLAIGNESQSSLNYSKSAILEKSAEYIVQLQTQVQHLQAICQSHGLGRLRPSEHSELDGQLTNMQNLDGVSTGHLNNV
jgi:hypothetical protein